MGSLEMVLRRPTLVKSFVKSHKALGASLVPLQTPIPCSDIDSQSENFKLVGLVYLVYLRKFQLVWEGFEEEREACRTLLADLTENPKPHVQNPNIKPQIDKTLIPVSGLFGKGLKVGFRVQGCDPAKGRV